MSVAAVGVSLYEPTERSVMAHWEVMGTQEDCGVCITLCGQSRIPGKIFCKKCRAKCQSRDTRSLHSIQDWAVYRRKMNQTVIWPEWM